MALTTKTELFEQGTGRIYTAPYPSNKKILSASWTPTFVSTEGSFKLTQTEPEAKKYMIDQSDTPVLTTYKGLGTWEFEFDMPNTAKANWEKLMSVSSSPHEEVDVTPLASSDPNGFKNTDILGILPKRKKFDEMVMIEFKESGTRVIIPRVDWVATFAKESEDEMACFKVKGTARASVNQDDPVVYILLPKDGKP